MSEQVVYAIAIPDKYIKYDNNKDQFGEIEIKFDCNKFKMNNSIVPHDVRDYTEYFGVLVYYNELACLKGYSSLVRARKLRGHEKMQIDDFKANKEAIDDLFSEILESDDFKNMLKKRYRNKMFVPQFYHTKGECHCCS